MLDFNELTDDEVILNTKALVGDENKITLNVLKHLSEIEVRRIYLKRGFDSLHQFCTNELKYSEGSAGRRIASMRLIRDLPQAMSSLKAQEVNLSTLTQLQSAIKKEEKRTGIKIEKKSKKLNLLESISNKSQNASQYEIIKVFPESSIPKEKERPLTDNLTEIKLIATKALLEKLSKLKHLLAHQKANPTHAELIEMVADMALKKLDLSVKPSNIDTKLKAKLDSNFDSKLKANQPVDQIRELATNFAKKPKTTNSLAEASTRYISKEMKKRVWLKSEGRCQYVDKITGRKCLSTYALQIDHVKPVFFGGQSTKDNLRLLCRSHNLWLGRQILET